MIASRRQPTPPAPRSCAGGPPPRRPPPCRRCRTSFYSPTSLPPVERVLIPFAPVAIPLRSGGHFHASLARLSAAALSKLSDSKVVGRPHLEQSSPPERPASAARHRRARGRRPRG